MKRAIIILGPQGSGKTRLARLLVHLTTGVDPRDVVMVDAQSWRACLHKVKYVVVDGCEGEFFHDFDLQSALITGKILLREFRKSDVMQVALPELVVLTSCCAAAELPGDIRLHADVFVLGGGAL